MSAFNYLRFVVGIPLFAVLLAFMYEITVPAEPLLRGFSTTQESSTGIDWYYQFMDFLPLVVLLLAAFALLVAVVVRRRRVIQ